LFIAPPWRARKRSNSRRAAASYADLSVGVPRGIRLSRLASSSRSFSFWCASRDLRREGPGPAVDAAAVSSGRSHTSVLSSSRASRSAPRAHRNAAISAATKATNSAVLPYTCSVSLHSRHTPAESRKWFATHSVHSGPRWLGAHRLVRSTSGRESLSAPPTHRPFMPWSEQPSTSTDAVDARQWSGSSTSAASVLPVELQLAPAGHARQVAPSPSRK